MKLPPPGKPTYELTGELAPPDPEGELEWTLDALTATARARSSQVRASSSERDALVEHTALAISKDPDFTTKGPVTLAQFPTGPWLVVR